MYAFVLATLFTTGNEIPDIGRRGGCHGCHGGRYGARFGGCYGGCYGCGGGCYGCGGGCYGCGGGMVISGGGGGAVGGGGGAAGGGGSPGGGSGSGASGGSAGQAGGGGGYGAMTKELESLKKSLEELKTEQSKLRVEALKQAAEELRFKAVDQKIDELRRAIEELKSRPVPRPIPLPPPKVRPEAAAPEPGKIQLEVPADAVVFVDDKCLGAARDFVTPALKAGSERFYQFEATVVRDGRNITRVKRVAVRPGATVRLTYEEMESGDHWTAAEETSAPAQFTVRLPADARLTIDDVVCPLTSDVRAFATSLLVPGREYSYLFKAEVVRDGRTIAQTRRVTFRPGERVTVSFDNLEVSSLTAR